MAFKMKRRTLLQGGLALASSSLFAPAIARAQSNPIQIGAILPMSGPQAQAGEAAMAGINVALAQINKKGGINGRLVEVVTRDDKATAVGAVAALRDLKAAGPNLMVGGLQSPMALGLSPILQEEGVLCVGSATAMSLTHDNFTPNFFRAWPNASMSYRGLGKQLGLKYPEIAEWTSIVYDGQAGHDAAAAFEAGVRETSTAKVNFTDPILVAPTAADFKVEISRIMGSNAEGLYLGILVGSAIGFLQQARSVGLTQRLKVIGEGGTDLAIGRALQKDTPSNIWSPGQWYPTAEPFKSNPFSIAAYEEYVALTGDKYPIGLFNMGYRPALTLLAGIEKAQSTETDAVIAAIEGITFDTLTGPYTFRKEDHQGYGTAVVANVGPSDSEPFYEPHEVSSYDESTVMEPATPGVAFSFT